MSQSHKATSFVHQSSLTGRLQPLTSLSNEAEAAGHVEKARNLRMVANKEAYIQLQKAGVPTDSQQVLAAEMAARQAAEDAKFSRAGPCASVAGDTTCGLGALHGQGLAVGNGIAFVLRQIYGSAGLVEVAMDSRGTRQWGKLHGDDR